MKPEIIEARIKELESKKNQHLAMAEQYQAEANCCIGGIIELRKILASVSETILPVEKPVDNE